MKLFRKQWKYNTWLLSKQTKQLNFYSSNIDILHKMCFMKPWL